MLDRIDDRQSRGVAVLDDAEQHRALAVRPHDVLLHQIAVADVADVPEEDGSAVRIADRNIVERLDCRRHRIGADGVVGFADLLVAAGEGQVLRVDRVHHLQRSEALGQQLCLIDVDHDLPVLSAGGCGQCDAVDRRDHLPQPVDTVVVELRFAEPVGAEADLQDGNGRRAVLHDDRRLGPGRQQCADRVGGGDDL